MSPGWHDVTTGPRDWSENGDQRQWRVATSSYQTISYGHSCHHIVTSQNYSLRNSPHNRQLPERISRITTVIFYCQNAVPQYVLTFICLRPALCFILVCNCGLTVRNKRICYVMLCRRRAVKMWRRPFVSHYLQLYLLTSAVTGSKIRHSGGKLNSKQTSNGRKYVIMNRFIAMTSV